MISALVVAAGLSSRMGRPKQLLPYAGHTVIEHVVSVLVASPVHEVLVVTGHKRAAVEAVLAKWPVRTVFNPGYAIQDMLSSLQVGLQATSTWSRAALLALGDMPGIEGRTVAQLIQAYQTGGDKSLYVPSYQMHAGHPILVPSRYWSAILQLPPGDSLRSVVQSKDAHIQWVTVGTPSILRDLDTPADYAQELALRNK